VLLLLKNVFRTWNEIREGTGAGSLCDLSNCQWLYYAAQRVMFRCHVA
jgi:hypothetical protein